jgi:glycopeptide antibiotics resistance protein
MPNFEAGLRHVLPWFLPGTALAAVVGLLAGRPLARALRTSYWVACLLVVGFGMVVAATLTPLRGAFNPDAIGGTCDLSRIGLAPLGDLLRFGDSSLNVALFIPLGVALGLLPGSKGKVMLVVGAIAMPFVIETTQLLVPALERGCQSADVFDNLTGLLVGLLIGTGVGRLVLMTLDEAPPTHPKSTGDGL